MKRQQKTRVTTHPSSRVVTAAEKARGSCRVLQCLLVVRRTAVVMCCVGIIFSAYLLSMRSPDVVDEEMLALISASRSADDSNKNRKSRKSVMEYTKVVAKVGLLFEEKTKEDGGEEQGKLQKNNHTLVIVMGSLRGGEKTWHSMYRHLLDPLEADLALMVGLSTNRSSSMYQRAKYIWEFPEYRDWGEAIDRMGVKSQNKGVTWRDVARKTKGRSAILGGTKESPTGSGAINYMARWWFSDQIRELHLLDRYERFIITRSDHFYLCHHPSLHTLSPPHRIWLPLGEDYGGFPDRHLVLGRENVLQAIDILPPLVRTPKKYMPLLNASTNPERLTRLRWKEQGLLPLVRRFPPTSFLASTKDDKTRWKTVQYWITEEPAAEIGVKYPAEFRKSSSTCKVHLATNMSTEIK